jgi:Protein of unknown function (DUF2934)
LAIRKQAEKKAEKAPARKPATTTTRKRKPKTSHEQIAERAYFIAMERGGSDLENWLLAEHELVGA